MSRGMVKAGSTKPWPARRLNYRDSRDIQALQVSDIVCGAIAFYLNGHYHKPNANVDRKQLCGYVIDRFKLKGYIEKKREKGSGPLAHSTRSVSALNLCPAILDRQNRPRELEPVLN